MFEARSTFAPDMFILCRATSHFLDMSNRLVSLQLEFGQPAYRRNPKLTMPVLDLMTTVLHRDSSLESLTLFMPQLIDDSSQYHFPYTSTHVLTRKSRCAVCPDLDRVVERQKVIHFANHKNLFVDHDAESNR